MKQRSSLISNFVSDSLPQVVKSIEHYFFATQQSYDPETQYRPRGKHFAAARRDRPKTRRAKFGEGFPMLDLHNKCIIVSRERKTKNVLPLRDTI